MWSCTMVTVGLFCSTVGLFCLYTCGHVQWFSGFDKRVESESKTRMCTEVVLGLELERARERQRLEDKVAQLLLAREADMQVDTTHLHARARMQTHPWIKHFACTYCGGPFAYSEPFPCIFNSWRCASGLDVTHEILQFSFRSHARTRSSTRTCAQEREELRQSVERLSFDNSRQIEHFLELEKLYHGLTRHQIGKASFRIGEREEEVTETGEGEDEGKMERHCGAEGARGGARNEEVVELRDTGIRALSSQSTTQSTTSYPSPPPSRPAHANGTHTGVAVEEDTCVGADEARQTQGGEKAGTVCQKRPTIVSKETYYSVKRDLGESPGGQRGSLLMSLGCAASDSTLTSPRGSQELDSAQERFTLRSSPPKSHLSSSSPSSYHLAQRRRLNVSWGAGARAGKAEGAESMSGQREAGAEMERWEVEEEQRADVSSSVFSILRSPMVNGTGVSPTSLPPPPPEPLAMSQSRFVCTWIPPPCLPGYS